MKAVTIYTGEFCGYCMRAKRLLESKSISYLEIPVGSDAQKRQEMIQKSGGLLTVPQIFIGDMHICGSDELAALERAGKLDMLLAA